MFLRSLCLLATTFGMWAATAPAPTAGIDASTLHGKLMMGYQGWFSAPGDGSPGNRWGHWFRGQEPKAENAAVDFWPDVSEFDADELYPTAMTLPDGSPARVFSSYNRKTVDRHFRWMREHGLDGVFLQRFTVALRNPGSIAFRDRVAENVRAGAEAHGRVFAMMYDISGHPPASLVATLTNDWAHLVRDLRYTESPRYLRHRGKPVVALWGFGFSDRPGTAEDAAAVIRFFKDAGCTVMGGVPTNWRTLRDDSQTNAAWAAVYRSFDILSPWAVGRYANDAQVDAFYRDRVAPDLVEAKAAGMDYLPVVFPGFSWKHLHQGKSNQIPRRGGDFYWRQVYRAVESGCTMVYGAMFDEVDEGTAMFKLAPTAAQVPAQGSFVPLDVDGLELPADWYLRVAGEATKMVRKEIPLQERLPIRPGSE